MTSLLTFFCKKGVGGERASSEMILSTEAMKSSIIPRRHPAIVRTTTTSLSRKCWKPPSSFSISHHHHQRRLHCFHHRQQQRTMSSATSAALLRTLNFYRRLTAPTLSVEISLWTKITPATRHSSPTTYDLPQSYFASSFSFLDWSATQWWVDKKSKEWKKEFVLRLSCSSSLNGARRCH